MAIVNGNAGNLSNPEVRNAVNAVDGITNLHGAVEQDSYRPTSKDESDAREITHCLQNIGFHIM